MTSGYIVVGTQRNALFSLGAEDLGVTAATVTSAMNEVDAASVTLPWTNERRLALLQKNAVIEIAADDEIVFKGDVAVAVQREDGSVELELDGALGWLADVVKPPFQINSASQNKAVGDFLAAIVSQYNEAVPVERMVQLGTVTVTGDLRMDHESEYMTMLDLVRECGDQLGGYVYMAYGSGVPVLHYVAQPSNVSAQVLEFGVNMLSAENELDFTDYASRVYATGSYYVTTTVDDKEHREQVDLDAGYVVDADAEAAFGRVDIAYRSDTDMGGDKDADIPDKTYAEAREIIRDEAQAVLDERRTPLQSLTMTAVDLAEIGLNYVLFSVGVMARAVCQPVRIDATMIVKSVRRDLINALDSLVTFGRMPRTLTGMMGGGGSSGSFGGSARGGASADAVTYTQQTRTEEEKAIARQNIGAAAAGSIPIGAVTSVNNMTGDVVIIAVPAFTAEENGKVLGVVDGQLAWVEQTGGGGNTVYFYQSGTTLIGVNVPTISSISQSGTTLVLA